MELEDIINLFEEVGQNEIVSKLKEVSKEEQKEFVNQVNELDKTCKGGIKDYIKRAKDLLANSAKKKTLFMTIKLKCHMIYQI